MWKINLGVDVAIFNQDWKSYLSTVNNANYSIARAGWIGDYVDPNTFLDVFLTGGGNNRTGFANSEYDKFIQLASTATNQTERYAYFQQAEAILVDQVPIIPIYTYTRVFLKHPSVQGWYANVLDRHPYKHVYLAAPATTPSEATHD
jgi:oligopeptide transport system substrate-binding protein